MTESTTRDRLHPIKVYVTEKERKTIKRMAKKMRMSVSTYLRTLGLGYTPKTVFDQLALKKLIKLHADQGRLGGLLKLWLKEFKDEPEIRTQLRSLLKEIERLQSLLAEWIELEKNRL
jgi:hypothetical protein